MDRAKRKDAIARIIRLKVRGGSATTASTTTTSTALSGPAKSAPEKKDAIGMTTMKEKKTVNVAIVDIFFTSTVSDTITVYSGNRMEYASP